MHTFSRRKSFYILMWEVLEWDFSWQGVWKTIPHVQTFKGNLWGSAPWLLDILKNREERKKKNKTWWEVSLERVVAVLWAPNFPFQGGVGVGSAHSNSRLEAAGRISKSGFHGKDMEPGQQNETSSLRKKKKSTCQILYWQDILILKSRLCLGFTVT